MRQRSGRLKQSNLRAKPLTAEEKAAKDALQALVFARDGRICLFCGDPACKPLVVNHRYGGHARPEEPQDVLTLGWDHNAGIEIDADLRREADRRGIRLRRWESPDKPVIDWLGRSWLLSPSGTRTETT